MSPSDLHELGDELRARREQSDLSLRAAATRSGLVATTVMRLEKGEIDSPRPEHLHALARAYGCDVEDFYALAGYLPAAGLPELRPYLRAKYDLPEQAADQIDQYFQALRTTWQPTANPQQEKVRCPFPSGVRFL